MFLYQKGVRSQKWSHLVTLSAVHWQVAPLHQPLSPTTSSVVPGVSSSPRTLFSERHFWGAVRTLTLATVYEVVGEPTSYCRNTLHDTRPESTKRFVRLIHVCEFDGAVATADAKQKLENQEIHNDVAHWSFQDFVLEALEGLHDEDLIQDTDYYEAKDELDSIFYE
jgi:hypothetical protein